MGCYWPWQRCSAKNVSSPSSGQSTKHNHGSWAHKKREPNRNQNAREESALPPRAVGTLSGHICGEKVQMCSRSVKKAKISKHRGVNNVMYSRGHGCYSRKLWLHSIFLRSTMTFASLIKGTIWSRWSKGLKKLLFPKTSFFLRCEANKLKSLDKAKLPEGQYRTVTSLTHFYIYCFMLRRSTNRFFFLQNTALRNTTKRDTDKARWIPCLHSKRHDTYRQWGDYLICPCLSQQLTSWRRE